MNEITGLSNDLLRIYEKEFNLQIKRTDGGHRRYTESDINQLVTIKKMIQEQKLSYKQVRNWLNGEDITPSLQDHKVSSNVQKELQEHKEMIRDLAEKLDKSMQMQALMMQKIIESETEKSEMRKTMLQIASNTEQKEEQVQKTLEEINHRTKSFDERWKEAKASKTKEPNKSFLQRLFGR